MPAIKHSQTLFKIFKISREDLLETSVKKNTISTCGTKEKYL